MLQHHNAGAIDRYVQVIGTPPETKELARKGFRDKELDAGLIYRLEKEYGLREVAVVSPF